MEHLVDCIGKIALRSQKGKRKSLKGKKSDVSSHVKQRSLDDFDFIEVDASDVMMICFLYFLEFGLIRKLKKH